jgi:hypothetical protein
MPSKQSIIEKRFSQPILDYKMTAAEALLHSSLYDTFQQLSEWERASGPINQGPPPLCTALLHDVQSLYPDILRALECVVNAPLHQREGIRTALAFVIGGSQYEEHHEATRYHGDIASLARHEPEFLKMVLGYANNISNNDRLHGNAKYRRELGGFDSEEVTLGSLLSQPVATALRLSMRELPKRLSLLEEYAQIAKQIDPVGYKALVDSCITEMARDPVDLRASDESGFVLRRLLFDGQIITTQECRNRLNTIAAALFGDMTGCKPARLADNLQALSHSPDFMEHAFFSDLYAELRSLNNDYSERDPCEERFKPNSVATQAQYCKILKGFLLEQHLDYRIKLAPWLLGKNCFADCLVIRNQQGGDDGWLDRAVIQGATDLMLRSVDNKPGQLQSRRLAWVSTLSETQCIKLCTNEDQLMLCFRATGHSGLIHRIKSDQYREEIFSADLGL